MIVDAVDLDNGFMDYSVDEVSLKRLVIQNAKHCIMPLRRAKFQISALVNVCHLSDVQTVVTNAEADPDCPEAAERERNYSRSGGKIRQGG